MAGAPIAYLPVCRADCALSGVGAGGGRRAPCDGVPPAGGVVLPEMPPPVAVDASRTVDGVRGERA